MRANPVPKLPLEHEGVNLLRGYVQAGNGAFPVGLLHLAPEMLTYIKVLLDKDTSKPKCITMDLLSIYLTLSH